MTRLELTGAADADLDEILTYSTIQFGDPIATEYFFGFDRAFVLLRQHPLIGRVAEEAGARVRCLSHQSHRIYYEVDGDTVRVLRILHHSMDVDGRFD